MTVSLPLMYLLFYHGATQKKCFKVLKQDWMMLVRLWCLLRQWAARTAEKTQAFQKILVSHFPDLHLVLLLQTQKKIEKAHH